MGRLFMILVALFSGAILQASEADVKIPDLSSVQFQLFGSNVGGVPLLYIGLVVCVLGMAFGLVQYSQTQKLEVHSSMQNVSNIIWETCKTYLFQQGKFLVALWVVIAVCIAYYFRDNFGHVLIILLASILGILGSYGVAWFGIRINTQANSRTAFSALRGNPLNTLHPVTEKKENLANGIQSLGYMRIFKLV